MKKVCMSLHMICLPAVALKHDDCPVVHVTSSPSSKCPIELSEAQRIASLMVALAKAHAEIIVGSKPEERVLNHRAPLPAKQWAALGHTALNVVAALNWLGASGVARHTESYKGLRKLAFTCDQTSASHKLRMMLLQVLGLLILGKHPSLQQPQQCLPA